MSELLTGAILVARGPASGTEERSFPESGGLRQAAEVPSVEFEAAFLAEMLKHAGFGKALGSQAGAAGETGFSDLLVREIAMRIARSRPIGIAEMVDAALERKGP